MAEGQPAHRAVALTWLCPSAPRLVALAEGRTVTDDLTTAALAVRFARPSPSIESIAPSLFSQSSILEAAATFLESDTVYVEHDSTASISHHARLIAERAESLAAMAKTVSPFAARIAGLLTPLGWMASATVAHDLFETVIRHADFSEDPASVELLYFGLTTDAVARRLAHRWKLPGWLADTISTLRLPLADAVTLGAHRELSKVLRFAVGAVEARHGSLGLLGSVNTAVAWEWHSTKAESDDPRTIPLLPLLLKTAAAGKRQSAPHRVAQLEDQVDALQAALRQSRLEFDSALRDAKLEAVAELAAGAGHEINNPLAVISGNAQLLKAREADPDRRKSLEVIIRQAGRVADLLQDLMQFARPAKPQEHVVSLRDLLAPVINDSQAQAELKSLRFQADTADGFVRGDLRQLRRTVTNLLRNALDAAPPGGLIRLSAKLRGGTCRITVEDSGTGPCAETVQHLFDPFYSGRDAGRGRGLGLSTAWKYARQHGGDIQFQRTDDGYTRFTLTLPAVIVETERQSA